MSGERLLGIDLGDARIGLAIDDGAGDIRGLATMRRAASIDDDVRRLTTICAEQRATRLIVGLPLHSDGAASEQGRRTEEWAVRISAALALPCEFVDERYSSLEAEAALRDRRSTRDRKRYDKAAIDSAAATVVLERWLSGER